MAVTARRVVTSFMVILASVISSWLSEPRVGLTIMWVSYVSHITFHNYIEWKLHALSNWYKSHGLSECKSKSLIITKKRF